MENATLQHHFFPIFFNVIANFLLSCLNQSVRGGTVEEHGWVANHDRFEVVGAIEQRQDGAICCGRNQTSQNWTSSPLTSFDVFGEEK